MTGEFQGLVTGAVLGCLMRAHEHGLLVHVEPVIDEQGNYEPLVRVVGRQSGERLLIRVEQARSCGHDGWVEGCPDCEREHALATRLIAGDG